MRSVCWVSSVLLWCAACGAPARLAPSVQGAPESGPELDACGLARQQAEARGADAERCRVDSPLVESELASAFGRLERALSEHLAAEGDEAPPVSAAQAQAIADEVWALLDALGEAPRDAALMERVEYAAEALLRAHEPEPLSVATYGLARALGSLRASVDEASPPIDPCVDVQLRAGAARLDADAACVSLDAP